MALTIDIEHVIADSVGRARAQQEMYRNMQDVAKSRITDFETRIVDVANRMTHSEHTKTVTKRTGDILVVTVEFDGKPVWRALVRGGALLKAKSTSGYVSAITGWVTGDEASDMPIDQAAVDEIELIREIIHAHSLVAHGFNAHRKLQLDFAYNEGKKADEKTV